MSNFTVGPFPCRNPSSFSKYTVRKDIEKTSCEQMPVVHRNVEGENNGECYKVKNPKTPFLLKHLEKYYIEQPKKEEETKKEEEHQPGTSRGMKRERSRSNTDEELEDPNEPSTSTPRKKKKTDQ